MSDYWPKTAVESARTQYAKVKTMKELSDWMYCHNDYDLIQEASSMWPVDYSKSSSHPLNLNNFSFKKIATLTSVDLQSIANFVLKDFKNINIYNLAVADWRANSKEQKFLIEKGFDRETHSVSVTKENYLEVFNIGNLFDFDYFSVTLQYQPPGSVLPRHVDFLGSMWTQLEKLDSKIIDLPYDHTTKCPEGYYAHRCMITLTDWYPGQVFGFEDQYWTRWKCGDVITFDWAHARHYTANASLAPRLHVKVSGITKNKNHWIFENLNNNTISNI